MTAIRHRQASDPKVIAIVGCDPSAPGGISRVIELVLGSALARAWCLVMVPTWVAGSRGRRIVAYLKALGRVWALAAGGRLQAAHLHMAARGSFWRKWLLSLPLPTLGVPYIVHIHDGSLPDWHAACSRHTQQRFAHFLERAGAVIALSPAWVNTLKPLAPRANWVAIANPVVAPDPWGHQACPHHTRAAPGPLRPEDIRGSVLFLGRLRLEKGLDDLLCAARLLKTVSPHVTWHLAGDGDLQAVQERISDGSLGDVVRLRGWLDGQEKRTALAQADLLVLASHAEGQPMAVLEAMAWGIPVVASKVGDVPQLLACGAGLVIPVGDPHALAQAVQSVLASPDRARHMGQLGREYVLKHHSVDGMVSKLDHLYRGLGLSATISATSTAQG